MGGRRVVAVVVALVVLSAGVAAAAPAQEQWSTSEKGPRPRAGVVEDLDEVTGPDGYSTVPDMEISGLRGRSSKVFTTEDRSVLRVEMASRPLHFETQDGWVEIDDTLRTNADGSLEVAAADYGARIAPSAEDGSFLAFEPASGGSIAWRLQGAADATATRNGLRTAAFDEALSGVDVELSTTPSGVKETIVLESSSSPNTFRFPMHLDGLTAELAAGGTVEYRDPAGGLAAVTPAGWAVDSSGNPRTELAPADAVSYALEADGGEQVLVLRINPGWLAAPERVFPVRVDPTTISCDVAGSADHYCQVDEATDTFVTEGDSGMNRSWFGQLKVGYQNGAANRTYIKFDLEAAGVEIGDYPDNLQVLNARLDFDMLGGGCVTGPARPVEIREVTEDWDQTDMTWSTSGATGLPATETTAITNSELCPSPLLRKNSKNQHPGSLAFLVDGWLHDPSSNYGVELKATNEGSGATGEFKYFASTDNTITENPPLLTAWVSYRPEFRQVDGDTVGSEETFTGFSEPGPDCYPEQPGHPYSPTGPQCRIDLYWKGSLQSAQKTIVLIHGGGWMALYDTFKVGASRRRSAEVAGWADALADAGYLVAAIDYRQDLYNHPDGYSLDLFNAWFHCTQRFEETNTTPYVWPPSDDWVEGTGPDLPYECEGLRDNFSSFTDDTIAANSAAVDDIHAAVEWLRDDTSGSAQDRLGIDPGNIYLVGVSAGAFSALSAGYDPTTTSDEAVDGVVAISGSHLIEDREIDATGRSMPTSTPPALIQAFEYDFAEGYQDSPLDGIDDEYQAGNYDFARVMAGWARDEGAELELRNSCDSIGKQDPNSTAPLNHKPPIQSLTRFGRALGDTTAFLDRLEASGGSETNMWFGATSGWTKAIGADLVEGEDGAYRYRVGDFNGDGIDDIIWLSPDSAACNTIWYGQGDGHGPTGTFARPDLADIVDPDLSGTAPDLLNNLPELRSSVHVVGDFDGSGTDDLFIFGPGTATDAVWYGESDQNLTDLASTGTFTRRELSSDDLDGYFDQLVVGDFNGDDIDDIFFFETDGDDLIWYGQDPGPSPTFPDDYFHPVTITNAYGNVDDPQMSPSSFVQRIYVGNFNGANGDCTNCDDLLFDRSHTTPYTSTTGLIHFGLDDTPYFETTHLNSSSVSVANETPTIPGDWDRRAFVGQIGQYDANDCTTCDDIYWFAPDFFGGDAIHTVFYGADDWFGTGSKQIFTDVTEANGPTTTDYDVVAGDFDGDGQMNLMFRHTGAGQEFLWDGFDPGMSEFYGEVTGQAFTHGTASEMMTSDRYPIVGQFADPSSTPGPVDILWHFTGDRVTTTPIAESHWWWCDVFAECT